MAHKQIPAGAIKPRVPKPLDKVLDEGALFDLRVSQLSRKFPVKVEQR